jgi:hypothetical protein
MRCEGDNQPFLCTSQTNTTLSSSARTARTPVYQSPHPSRRSGGTAASYPDRSDAAAEEPEHAAHERHLNVAELREAEGKLLLAAECAQLFCRPCAEIEGHFA